MLLSRSLRSLEAFAKQFDGKAEAKLVEIYNSLMINYFIPSDSNFKPELLQHILQTILPLSCSESLSIRFQAISFLTRFQAILSAFSPAYLLTAYSGIDTNEFEPTAQALMLNYYTIALHFLAPTERENHISTCHTLLLNSEPKYLSKLTESDWKLLSTSFSVAMLGSIVKFLLSSNDKILIAVLAFLVRDPNSMLPLVLERSDIQFLKEIIPKIPLCYHVPVALLKEKLIKAIHSENTSEVSGALEVSCLLMARPRLLNDKEHWKELFVEVESLWNSTRVASLKSAIIDFFSTAAENKVGMIPVKILHRFLSFNKDFPTPILVAALNACRIYTKNEKRIPKGLLEFLKMVFEERDPLLYVAGIEFLTDCIVVLKDIVPNAAEQLVKLCLNPLPNYFVEQISILHMLLAIKEIKYPLDKIGFTPEEILFQFLQKPHPYLIDEIPNVIEQFNVSIPIFKLDWIENATSYIFLFKYCDPLFVVELVDTALINPASFPATISYLISHIKSYDDTKFSSRFCRLLFKRVIYIIFKAIKLLKLDFLPSPSLKKRFSKNWRYISKSLRGLFAVINESSLPVTQFGQIIESCLIVISSTIKHLELNLKEGIDIVKIATIFSTAFTPQSCTIISEISKKFTDPRFYKEISKFFTSTFQFDHSVKVSLTAIECLHNNELENVDQYINAASNENRIVLLMRRDQSYLYNTFLAFKNDPDMADYVNKCIEQIPFDQWQVEESDHFYISSLRGIKITNLELLDKEHRIIVDTYPDSFVILNKKEYDNSIVHEELSNSMEFQTEESSSDDTDFPAYEEIDKQKYIAEPFSPYPAIAPNNSIILTFFWNSKRKLSDDDFLKAENYVLSLFDIKLDIAFLSYAIRHGYQIQTEKWTEQHIYSINRQDQKTFILFCLISNFIQKKWDDLSDSESLLIKNTLKELGVYDSSPYNLMKLYKEEHGITKMVTESIIKIDLSRFDEFPFFADIFKDKDNFENIIDELFEKMQDENNGYLRYEFTTILSEFLIPETQKSKFSQFVFPNKVPFIAHYMPPFIGLQNFETYQIDDKLKDKLLAFFSNCRLYDDLIYNILFHLNISKEEYDKINELLLNLPISFPYSPHLYLNEVSKKDKLLVTILSSEFQRLSSFTREIVSFLKSPFGIDRQLRDIKNLFPKLTTVFYILLYKGFETIDIHLADKSFSMRDEDLLLVTESSSINLEIVNKLKPYFNTTAFVTNKIAKQFYKLDFDILCKCFNTVSADAALIELSEKLIDTIIHNPNYYCIVLKIIKTILNNTELIQLCMIFTKDTFLNADLPINIFLILVLFEKHLAKSPDTDIYNIWKDMKENLPDKIANKQLEEMIMNKSTSDDIQDVCTKILFNQEQK